MLQGRRVPRALVDRIWRPRPSQTSRAPHPDRASRRPGRFGPLLILTEPVGGKAGTVIDVLHFTDEAPRGEVTPLRPRASSCWIWNPKSTVEFLNIYMYRCPLGYINKVAVGLERSSPHTKTDNQRRDVIFPRSSS